MPMFASNVVPDVTGRSLGSADKQWDIYARNITLTGSLSGSGLTTSDVTNAQPDVDSVNVQSGLAAGALSLRFRISNPLVGPVLGQFKNMQLQLGGVNPADSHDVPMSIFSNAADTDNLISIYQRGSLSNLAAVIDAFGRFISYCPTYASFGFAVYHLNEANPIWGLDANGSAGWGAGGANVLDTFLTRVAASSLSLNNGAGGWANLNVGQLGCNAAQGTPPLTVISNTLVANLNADRLDGADWTAPPAIGSVTPNDVHAIALSASGQIQSTLNDSVTPPLSIASTVPVLNLTVKQAFDLTINDKLLNDGSGFKHKRVTTGSVAASGSVNLVITWTTPFADTNYTVLANIFDSANSGSGGAGLRVSRITQLNTDHIAVYVVNDDAAAAHTGTVQAIGIRG